MMCSLTGSDEHGQKIGKTESRRSRVVTPISTSTAFVAIQTAMEELNITNDDFIRTTEERRRKVVQMLSSALTTRATSIWASMRWYCIPDETFWPENKLTPEHICPDCGRPLQKEVSEDAYFFKMSKYADQWLKYIDEHPDFIQRNPARMKWCSSLKAVWKISACHYKLYMGASCSL